MSSKIHRAPEIPDIQQELRHSSLISATAPCSQYQSMIALYMLAYQWPLDKESTLPHDEIETRVIAITDYLDIVWKHKEGKRPEASQLKSASPASKPEL